MGHFLEPSYPSGIMISLPYPSTNLDLVSLVVPGQHGVIADFNSWAITSVLN
jgi:hypothetical protein